MANGVTYGINFPFNDSLKGDYLSLSQNPDQEIRSNLIHLILTRRGSRYFLPDFVLIQRQSFLSQTCPLQTYT